MEELVIRITGASDDLIEIYGDIREEFTYHSESDGNLVACSDGTVVRVFYDTDGVWRVTLIKKGTASFSLTQAPVGDDDVYSDVFTLEDETITWVLHGLTVASR